MKSIKLTFLVILFVAVAQSITFAQAVQVNPVNPSSPDFQAELSELQIANPHLGPNHDLVYPGDIIIFDDGTEHVIQEGEYESMLLLEYLQNQNLSPDRVVSIIQTNSIQTKNSILTWPWYMTLLAMIIAGALVAMAVRMYQLPNLIGRVTVEHNHPPAQVNVPAPEIWVLDASEEPSNPAPTVTIKGNNNSVAIGSNPRSESYRNNEVESNET